MRMALKVVMQNDGDFMDVIVLNISRILTEITSLWKTYFVVLQTLSNVIQIG